MNRSAAIEPDSSQPPWTPPANRGGVHRGSRRRRQNAPYILATLPAAFILGLFFVAPELWAIWLSLTDRSIATQTHFVGFDNYRLLWRNPDLSKFIGNTVVFVAGSAIIGQTGLGLALALLIDHATKRRHPLSHLAYAAVLVAWIMPPVFAGNVWGSIFGFRHGLLNTLLRDAGAGRVDLLGQHAMLAVIIADVWRGTAFAMVVFLGALRTVPAALHEAARVDGASSWRQFVDQTLPSIRLAVAVVLVMTTIVTTGSFLLILILTNGDPGYRTETLALFAYHRAVEQYEVGSGAAISVLMLGFNLVFAAVFLRVAGAYR